MKLDGLQNAPFKILPIICGLLLFVSGCLSPFNPSWPLLYKPNCDISPVLKLQLPEQIDTLAGVPRTETVFENGTNKFGGPLPDEIKEMVYLKKGTSEYKFDGKVYLLKDTTEYKLVVFYNEAAAIKEYGRDKERHVFREITENGLTGRVHYTEQPRSDPEGGSGPMGYYVSRAYFRLHNVFIRVTTQDDKPQSDKLTIAVKDLAKMLNVALVSPNQMPK
jgi:hypothetical protein